MDKGLCWCAQVRTHLSWLRMYALLVRPAAVGPQHERRVTQQASSLHATKWLLFLRCCCWWWSAGLQPAVLNAQTGEELAGNDVEGVLVFKRPWPSLARTVYGDHKRYLDVYLNPYKVRCLRDEK